jgi:hypothetical protein
MKSTSTDGVLVVCCIQAPKALTPPQQTGFPATVMPHA